MAWPGGTPDSGDLPLRPVASEDTLLSAGPPTDEANTPKLPVIRLTFAISGDVYMHIIRYNINMQGMEFPLTARARATIPHDLPGVIGTRC
ncbi:unnamed protein product [Plutella xylostella]|uniref:(diamondback moth) hypothetical protein n=1 Tax=Plutella xylostella TaxID=51655 RepID=A0A8S4D4Y4_PLUXY|nr:unnamed protein product [Plutella xylostella]